MLTTPPYVCVCISFLEDMLYELVLQVVRAIQDSKSKQGDTIKSGTLIRLQHMRTRKWLHSHLHASPISGNLEVSDDGFHTVLRTYFLVIYVA